MQAHETSAFIYMSQYLVLFKAASELQSVRVPSISFRDGVPKKPLEPLEHLENH
jgi:hypothetical protein